MDELKFNTKRTWAEIDLNAVRDNYMAIRRSLPDDCRFLGVVKANAYGHGALEVSSLLQECGADYLAVSCLDEALDLREGGISMPILILGHTPAEYTGLLIENNITQTVTCLAKACEYSEACAKLGKSLKVHHKIDTGMSRLGYIVSGDSFEEGTDNIIESCRLPYLINEGIYTHFASSDEYTADAEEYTLKQFGLFMAVIRAVKEKGGIEFEIRHCANSGAVVNYPYMALDMVRPGYLLYGYGDPENRIGLRPCMRLLTTISTIKHYAPGTCVSYGRKFTTDRRMRVGVLAAGYADGLPRAASGKCSFKTAGGYARQIGSICMDMCMADLTDLPEAEVGSEVELFGPESDINKLAEAACTIPYEILCSVTKRVPRIYKNLSD